MGEQIQAGCKMPIADRLDQKVTDLEHGQSPFNDRCVHGRSAVSCVKGITGVAKATDARRQPCMALDSLIELPHEFVHELGHPSRSQSVGQFRGRRMAPPLTRRQVKDVDVVQRSTKHVRAQHRTSLGERGQTVLRRHPLLGEVDREPRHLGASPPLTGLHRTRS
ncbi:hypothetical protein D3C81_1169590 [compost metagenome]